MNSTLALNDLHVTVEGKEVVKGINLELHYGKIYALMGANGSGKSSLAHAIMGHPRYKITKGKILLNSEDITSLPAHERAKRGIFLSFQYPTEIPGVTLSHFLRTALQAVKGKQIPVVEFHQMLKEKMNALGIDSSFSKRYLNQGFSGGEKKRAEILQMSVLQPAFAVLDEFDSGLDVDALKIVAQLINKSRSPERSILMITHYNRLLDYILPDEVYIMSEGNIVASGDKKLAKEIEEKGYESFMEKKK